MTQLQIEEQRTHEVGGQALVPILSTEKEKTSAPITIQSRRTGKDYTFKISRSQYQDIWYTNIWLEKGGYLNFEHIGVFYSNRIFLYKKGKPVDTRAAKAIAWVLRRISNHQFEKLHKQVAIMHMGKCLACGRPLTDAESIKRGVGPVCAEDGR